MRNEFHFIFLPEINACPNMKLAISISLLLFVSIFSIAKDKEHFLSLSGQKKVLPNYDFELLQVTNATGDDHLIGFVQKSIGYKAVPAYFENRIDKEIALFIRENLKEADARHALIIRVNKIKISETYNGINETAVARVNLSFIFKEEKKYFKKLTIEEAASKSVSAGITKSQPQIIAEAIAKCFDTFYERAKEVKLKNYEIEKKDLLLFQSNDQAIFKSMLLADRSKKGIYTSFIDFQENTPESETSFDVSYETKSTEDESITIKFTRIKDTKTGKKIDDVWGFTDGSVVYARVGKKYHPLHKDDKGYFLELKYQDPSVTSTAGVVGGLIGSGIAAASAPVREIRLDYNTGKLIYSDQQSANGAQENAYAISFYSSSFNSEETALELIINGESKCILKEDSWYKHTLLKASETINILVKSTNGMETKMNITSKTANKDMYLIIDKRKKPPVVNRVYANDLDRMRVKMTRENRIY